MAREELKWQNIDADDLPAAVTEPKRSVCHCQASENNARSSDDCSSALRGQLSMRIWASRRRSRRLAVRRALKLSM
jgi:hypothetical protein